MNKLATLVFSSLTIGALFTSLLAVPAHAQTTTFAPIPTPIQNCIPISSNIGFGANDYAIGDEVTTLQNFLVSQGFFASAYVGTGHFGPLTLRAVESFQSAHAIPATGFVGPLTRAEIATLQNCTTPTSHVTPTSPTTSTVSISSLSSTSARAGDTLTVYGTGFTSSNTILFGNLVATRDVVATSPTSLTFTIPSSLSPNCSEHMACPAFVMLLSPNTYNVSVENASGTSNSLPLIITAGGTQIMIPQT